MEAAEKSSAISVLALINDVIDDASIRLADSLRLAWTASRPDWSASVLKSRLLSPWSALSCNHRLVSLCTEQVGDEDRVVTHNMQPKHRSHLDRLGTLRCSSLAVQ